MYDQMALSAFQESKPRTVPAVMIVESDADFAEALQEILQDDHIATILATTKKEALQATQLLTPLLFMINQHLRDGDGMALYDQLHQKKHLSNVPALILSTNIGRHQHLLEQRGIPGLELPIDLDGLISAIRSLLPSQMI